jgi:hypothetical protein
MLRSELQLRDVRNLISSVADLAYVREWAARLAVSELLESILNERHTPPEEMLSVRN